MENAVDALKIAFAVLMFVLALSLSISSFSVAIAEAWFDTNDDISPVYTTNSEGNKIITVALTAGERGNPPYMTPSEYREKRPVVPLF